MLSSTAPIRVLVVDDSEDDFRIVVHLLRKNTFATYDVEWAPSFEAGIEALQRRAHDVGLFDYLLNGHTGLELLRTAQTLGCELPLILLTGHDSPEVDREASAAGAADYLCKSGLSTAQLERAIRYSLRHAAMLAVVRQGQSQFALFMRSVPCAVCIRSEAGEVLFENDLYRDHFEGADPAPRSAPIEGSEPFAYSEGGRDWLVNTFPMVDAHGRHLRGLTAVEVTERVRVEANLRRTTRILNGLLSSLPLIASSVDAKGAFLESNGRGLRDIGLVDGALVGVNVQDVYPKAAAHIRKAIMGGTVNFLWEIPHGGRMHTFDSYFRFDEASGRGAVGFSVNVTERLESEAERRMLERRILDVSDAERQRIGADLHDGLGQHLTGIACMAAALRDRLRVKQVTETEQADVIASLVNEAISQTRALARGLSPVQLEQAGLLPALDDLTYQVKTVYGVECRFTVFGDPPECAAEVAGHLFRITQEAINNAVRHGQARNIEVVLRQEGRGHRLSIEDDGTGFDPQSPQSQPGVGLRLMRYRAGVIGAAFLIESKPGEGARISCTFAVSSDQYLSDENEA